MKKMITLVVLMISITTQLFAQLATQEDKTYELPSGIVVNRRFFIDLGKGNKLTLELTDISDLKSITPIDSVLRVFLSDITPLKDSLADPLTSKRIDYVTDAGGKKKIRFQQFSPKGSNFLLDHGDLSSLKISQDTINIIGVIDHPYKANQKISLTHHRYYHLVFYLNNINELRGYMQGTLSEKLQALQNNKKEKWPLLKGGSYHYLQADASISAQRPFGFTPGETGDFLEGYATVNVQNYKSYFVPSFTLGAKLVLANRDRTYKWEPGISWEPHFIFGRDSLGRMQTYRNDFLTLSYGQGGTTDHDTHKPFAYSTVFSLGYLINRNGNFFVKHTFRLGAGKLQLMKTSIEPSLYFNDFFKGVTPGIRISQSF